MDRRQFLIAAAGVALMPPAGRQHAGRPRQASDLAWHITFLTNQQRAWRRVPELSWSEDLAAVARAHSADMLKRRFFEHQNPDGLGPEERVARRGLRLRVSENIYMVSGGPEDPAELASMVVRKWVATSGHRRNILEPSVSLVGVGSAHDHEIVAVTQLFGG